MKIWKRILFVGLASFLCSFVALVLVVVFYDGPIPLRIEIYEAPKTGAQAVVIHEQDFSGQSTYYVGARGSESAKWRRYHRSLEGEPKKPAWCQEPIESRKLGVWRWQDANLKRFHFEWMN